MTSVPILCRVQALYPFKSNDPSSLCFNQDDQIDVLNKLPSGWWDGLCNDTRGWFPSNYVKLIEDLKQESDDEISPPPSKSEYRLSLAYNNSTSTPHEEDQRNNWIVQRTEDGTGFYHFNPITGEMKFNQEEDDEEENIPEEESTASFLINDSESESDYRSTLDIPWSEGSTLFEEKSQWVNRATPSIQQLKCESFEKPPRKSPSRRPSIRKVPSLGDEEPLSWNKLSGNIAIAIHQLTTAAKNGLDHLYHPCSIAIVNSIRSMLIASSTIDKDSGHIKSNGTLRSHHRAMMASMSKLTLTTQTHHSSIDPDQDDDTTVSKILAESSDLLLMIRNFINTCQDLSLPLTHTDPQWIQKQENSTTTLTNSNRKLSISSSINQRYSLQVNLAENLETMGTCIQDSAETIIKCIASSSNTDQVSLEALLFTHFRNLSNQTGLFLGYLDETDFSIVQDDLEMIDLLVGKQALSDSLGLLFFKLQALTNEDKSNFENCLKETEEAAGSLYNPIELICASVLRLAQMHRSRSNSNASFLIQPMMDKTASTSTTLAVLNELATEDDESDDQDEPDTVIDRHHSELIPNKTMIQPPTIQRSHTAPPPPTQNSNSKLKKFFGDEAPLAVVAASNPSIHERPDYLQYDYGPNEVVFNMEGNVRGGTLPALVERLTLHDYLDMNFINTFLLTYRSFCSSVDLLNLLEARYNLQCPPGLTEEEATIWEEKKLKLVRLRVFNVLKNWLELYYNEDDSILLDRLLDFTNKHIKVTLKFSNGQLESLIQRRRDANMMDNGGLKKMILTLPDPPEPILPRNRRRFKLLDIDTLEMARQLTIMDFRLYSAIKPIECLDKAWSSQEDDNVAVNIRASIEYCNQVTSWVSDVILSQHDIKKRSVLIKYWVQVAEKCRILNNFNTCMAILSAFDNSSVGRLKRTWEVVGARTNQILQQIRKLMGANRNFTEYRAIIHSINPPCIPFLGIYLQDLTFIEDGNANELKKSKDLINFAKRAKTAEVIREIQQYQSSLYQLKPVADLQEFIKSNLKSTRDEEQLYKESLKLEPREREDEKITRLLQESGFL
ncbi:ras guanine nucleotide exchange factor domain-containing protein [Pilaira anomala]|nr:ras guanine nucleotide exchange factor domain-containing protein [Pilaira anomala]